MIEVFLSCDEVAQGKLEHGRTDLFVGYKYKLLGLPGKFQQGSLSWNPQKFFSGKNVKVNAHYLLDAKEDDLPSLQDLISMATNLLLEEGLPVKKVKIKADKQGEIFHQANWKPCKEFNRYNIWFTFVTSPKGIIRLVTKPH